jgi:spore cortex protein
MKKTTFTTLSAALILGGLVGCATNEEAVDNRYDNTTRPIGYYSNDDREGDLEYNNGRGMDQGPLTDMFDIDDNNQFKNDRAYDTRFINTRRKDIGRNMNNGNGDMNYRNGTMNDYGDGNVNQYGNGKMNMTNNGYNYDKRYARDGSLAERIDERVENMAYVEDVNTVVYNDTIIVAIDTDDRNDKDVEKKVRRAIQGLAHDKKVRIVTDENMFKRIGTINDGLRDGDAIDDFQSDFREIMDDIGDAMKRPFDNNDNY